MYRDPAGATINDREELARIYAVVVPPAWTKVWICPDRNGHVQAMGRDARGRKQYRYHARWLSVRDESKFERLLVFRRSLPAIRRQVDIDLATAGLPREKVVDRGTPQAAAACYTQVNPHGFAAGSQIEARACCARIVHLKKDVPKNV